MAIHPADRKANNPRMQCVVCAKWKRLHGRDANGEMFYRFFGGCGYTNGDHAAGKGKGHPNDVCDDCCQIACRAITEKDSRATLPSADRG